jgi:hypothetical protein
LTNPILYVELYTLVPFVIEVPRTRFLFDLASSFRDDRTSNDSQFLPNLEFTHQLSMTSSINSLNCCTIFGIIIASKEALSNGTLLMPPMAY